MYCYVTMRESAVSPCVGICTFVRCSNRCQVLIQSYETCSSIVSWMNMRRQVVSQELPAISREFVMFDARSAVSNQHVGTLLPHLDRCMRTSMLKARVWLMDPLSPRTYIHSLAAIQTTQSVIGNMTAFRRSLLRTPRRW
jgi:hypothetical protein